MLLKVFVYVIGGIVALALIAAGVILLVVAAMAIVDLL
jgi:hypothetical protein